MVVAVSATATFLVKRIAGQQAGGNIRMLCRGNLPIEAQGLSGRQKMDPALGVLCSFSDAGE